MKLSKDGVLWLDEIQSGFGVWRRRSLRSQVSRQNYNLRLGEAVLQSQEKSQAKGNVVVEEEVLRVEVVGVDADAVEVGEGEEAVMSLVPLMTSKLRPRVNIRKHTRGAGQTTTVVTSGRGRWLEEVEVCLRRLAFPWLPCLDVRRRTA